MFCCCMHGVNSNIQQPRLLIIMEAILYLIHIIDPVFYRLIDIIKFARKIAYYP